MATGKVNVGGSNSEVVVPKLESMTTQTGSTGGGNTYVTHGDCMYGLLYASPNMLSRFNYITGEIIKQVNTAVGGVNLSLFRSKKYIYVLGAKIKIYDFELNLKSEIISGFTSTYPNFLGYNINLNRVYFTDGSNTTKLYFIEDDIFELNTIILPSTVNTQSKVTSNDEFIMIASTNTVWLIDTNDYSLIAEITPITNPNFNEYGCPKICTFIKNKNKVLFVYYSESGSKLTMLGMYDCDTLSFINVNNSTVNKLTLTSYQYVQNLAFPYGDKYTFISNKRNVITTNVTKDDVLLMGDVPNIHDLNTSPLALGDNKGYLIRYSDIYNKYVY